MFRLLIFNILHKVAKQLWANSLKRAILVYDKPGKPVLQVLKRQRQGYEYG
jgi:hypothetical protein